MVHSLGRQMHKKYGAQDLGLGYRETWGSGFRIIGSGIEGLRA